MSIFFEEHDTVAAVVEPDPWPNLNDCRSCGLCLNGCPTYQLSGQEADSPRGRLRDIVRLLRDKVTLEEEQWQNLNNCLQCRNCERVCPSKIPYHRHLHEVLAQQPQDDGIYKKAGLKLAAADAQQRNMLGHALNLYRASGIQDISRALGVPKLLRLDRAERLINSTACYQSLKSHYHPTSAQRGTVALFTGCASSLLDYATLHDTVTVLTALGYDVHVPEAQRCCGTLHCHNQDQASADRLKQINVAAFEAVKADAILYTASGCGPRIRRLDKERLPAVYEVCEFIIDQAWPSNIELQPFTAHVALHQPCTMRFPHALEDKPRTLLARIPDLKLTTLSSSPSCCGAAGSYMLTHPQSSDGLAGRVLENLRESRAHYLATTNIGCALHLAANARAAGMAIEVIHPVSLLARQLSTPSQHHGEQT